MAAKCVWKICFSVYFSLNFVTTSVVRKRTLFPLDIIHYNDFHARFEETSVTFPICSTNDTNCIGGFARLYHGIKALQKEKPDAVILNAGDAYQGTYWYTLLKWNVTQHFMNLLPHDAHTLGNHEFDNGVEGLAPYLAGLRAPMVVANIDTSQEPSLNGLYKPHIVIERKGRKIGIIGVLTPDTETSSKTGFVKFLDPIKVIKEQVKLLTDQGVDIIIILSHCGIKYDLKIAKEAGENVDIIVGGHSHSLLWNEKPTPSHEEAIGPYPIIVESKCRKGHYLLVVTASAFSKYLGNLTAFFDAEGELVSFSEGPVFLNRSIPEDPEIKAHMQPYVDKLHTIVNEVVGHSEIDLPDQPCGGGECILGDLIADSMLFATNELHQSKLPSVAFVLRNMIRGAIAKGDVTRGGLINSLPFGNRVVSFTIKGKYLLEAMNRCLFLAWSFNPFIGPWIPQVAGMRVKFETTERKVEYLLIKHGDAFHPLQPDYDYRVVTPEFLYLGGNGFKMLKKHSRNMTSIGVDFEILEKYVKKISPVNMQLDERISVIEKNDK